MLCVRVGPLLEVTVEPHIDQTRKIYITVRTKRLIVKTIKVFIYESIKREKDVAGDR